MVCEQTPILREPSAGIPCEEAFQFPTYLMVFGDMRYKLQVQVVLDVENSRKDGGCGDT